MRASRGFTLVEMLVAISVAALLVSLVYGAVRVGQRSASAVDRRIDQAEVMRIGWQYIHGAIVRARPVADPDNPDDRTGFRGQSDALEFVADMPAYVGLGGLIRIRLVPTRTETGEALLLTRERYDPKAEGRDDAVQEAVLVEELERLQISYFGRREAGESPAWHSDWESPNTLPNLVRIDVDPSSQRAWPVLVARPMTGTTPLPEDSESFASDGEVTE